MDAKRIIDKRIELWNKDKDIEKDKDYREAVADYLVSDEGKDLRQEIQEYPELIIEMLYVIVDKEQNTVPFFLNEVQREFIDTLNGDIKLFKEGKLHHLKYLVLKGRQQGFTSLINAYQLARAITQVNFSGYTLADSADNTEDIFQDKAKYYFDNLPDKVKPTQKYSNRRELDFSKETGGMNSKWRVATAGNIDAGRSKTLSFFHGSEVAFWKDARKILIGLSEAFTKQCIVILESTANGFNEFREMWNDDNNYTNLFYEWWKSREYTLHFENKLSEDIFKTKVNTVTDITDDAESGDWCLYRCKWLKESKGLSWGQIYWYYHKWKDKGVSIKQEYPCTAEEAYLATGRNYFNTEIVANRIDYLENIYKGRELMKGYFVYEYGTSQWTNEKIILDDTIKFVEDQDLGYITIYNDDIPQTEPYTIGADTAGDGSDWNTGHVLNNNQEQVAVIRLQKDEDLFADQLYCLGKMYNDAMIAPEINFSTYVTNTLKNREYPNIYVRETSPDSISRRLIMKYGFNTNKATRPVMLAELKTLVRDRIGCIVDIGTLKEMLTFIVNERGKPEAIVGEHDDLIMGLAIGLYAQEQQLNELTVPAEELEGYYTEAELEDLGYSVWEIRDYMSKK